MDMQTAERLNELTIEKLSIVRQIDALTSILNDKHKDLAQCSKEISRLENKK